MHSKWQLWDFFSSYPADSWTRLSGRIVLLGFDPLSLRLLKDHLWAKLSAEERPRSLFGTELKQDWLESEYLGMDLFGGMSTYAVHRPDEMNAACKEFYLNKDLDYSAKTTALCFESETPFAKKVMKLEGTTILQLEAPRFWETGKLIDFLCIYFRLPLSYEAKAYLMEAVEHEFATLYAAFRLIRLNVTGNQETDLTTVKSLVGQDRMDQFALATDFGKKAYVNFFERLLAASMDFDRMRGFFAFMQGHMSKLADTSYLKDKARLNQYDKELLALSRAWRLPEIEQALRLFHDWEMACKKKDPMLVHELRGRYQAALQGMFAL